MAYYIFLKSLKILEEFRKNPHIKIPPKSPCINLQSLGKFKIAIFIPNRISLQFLAQSAQPPRWPIQPFGPRGRPSASSSSFTCADRAPPPPHAPSRRPPPAPWRDPNGQAPLNNSAPSSIGSNRPLLHFGNGSIEDDIYRRHPAYPGHLRLPPGPIKGAHTPVEHLTPSPHLLPSSLVPAPSSLGAEVPPPVCHLFIIVQAPVSGPSIAPRRLLHIATLMTCRRGTERPLG
jgi:hypothetical protein